MTAWLPSWCSETFLFCFSAHKDNKNKVRVSGLFTAITQILSVIAVSLFFYSQPAWANNVSIANQKLVEQDTSADTIKVQFDISWSNSWRDATNYDAAWVFFKYTTDTSSGWSHATLKTAGTNPTNFSQGSGTQVDIVVPTDKKGCFIQRSSLGSGSLSTTSMQVVWDYGQDGVSDANASGAAMQVKVFAIEMVYLPQGGFYVGDASDGTYGELEFGGASTSLPGAINSEAGMSFGSSASQWYYNAPGTPNSGEAADGASFEVSAAFPKGYQAFYLMKYEITEGQWIGFFNTLTSAPQTTRDITAASGKNSDSVTDRNTISWSSGDATTTRTDRVCNYLSWMDICAYADWAGLRPITELEFEKACRGTLYPVDGEYAWGSTSQTTGTNMTGTSEDGTETFSSPSNNNVHFGNTNITGGDGPNRGPVRAGIFATSTSTTRVLSGAGFYGNLELSGNGWEHVVTLGNGTGRGFAGTHGDGNLTTLTSYEGNATNKDWPGMDTTSTERGVTGATGSGLRGGGWSETTNRYMEISNREQAAKTATTRTKDYGGRLARTAP